MLSRIDGHMICVRRRIFNVSSGQNSESGSLPDRFMTSVRSSEKETTEPLAGGQLVSLPWQRTRTHGTVYAEVPC